MGPFWLAVTKSPVMVEAIALLSVTARSSIGMRVATVSVMSSFCVTVWTAVLR